MKTAVFASSDRTAALAAIDASEARWVYAPAAFPLRFDPGNRLEVAVRRPAGTLYRVAPAPAQPPAQ